MDENETQTFLETLIEIEPLDRQKFLRACEFLTRVGILSTATNTLWQSCHIFHKRGRYFIVHFKQMFELDGKLNDEEISDEDLDRVEKVAILLTKWGLINPMVELDKNVSSTLDIIPFKDKAKYNLKPKYTIGSKKREYGHSERGRRPGDY